MHFQLLASLFGFTNFSPGLWGYCCYILPMCSVMSGSFATPWTVASQAPLSMGFFRQEYWSGLPFPPPGDLPDPGIEPSFPRLSWTNLVALFLFRWWWCYLMANVWCSFIIDQEVLQAFHVLCLTCFSPDWEIAVLIPILQTRHTNSRLVRVTQMVRSRAGSWTRFCFMPDPKPFN